MYSKKYVKSIIESYVYLLFSKYRGMVLHKNLYKAGVVFGTMFSCFVLYLALMP